jgi:predicted translin family RNA/ssDNA-binding protein
MAKQVKSQKEMKVEDAFYNSSVNYSDLFGKIKERDALITAQKENITLLKRQLAMQETIFSKLFEFFCQMQQQMNLTAQDAKTTHL